MVDTGGHPPPAARRTPPMSATLPATAAVAAPSWWRETMAGSVGSIAVLAMVMTLGVLALAPLGAAGVPAGLQAGLVTAALGGLVYAGVLMLLSPRTLPRTLDVLRAGFDRSDRSLAAVLGEPGASRPA